VVDTLRCLWRVHSAHGHLTRGNAPSAWRPQAGLVAADGVAGARHRASFCPGVHHRAELLKRAVILCVVAAVVWRVSVSVSYRRHAICDHAKVAGSQVWSTTCSWTADRRRAGNTSLSVKPSCAATLSTAANTDQATDEVAGLRRN